MVSRHGACCSTSYRFKCRRNEAADVYDFKEFRVAHEGIAKETDRLRMSVGSLQQDMMHQLQMKVRLSRERLKQLEQVIESLQKNSPAEKARTEPRRRNCETPLQEVPEDHRRF